MLLRTRFLLLLLVLGVTVAANVGSTVWAVLTLERELSWPLASIEQVMRRLGEVKRAVGTLHNALPVPVGADLAAIGPGVGPAGAPADAAAVDQADRQTRAALEVLRRDPDAAARAGPSMLRNLEARVARALADARAGLGGDEDALRRARAGLFDLHELIEATESRILADANMAVEFGAGLRRTVILIAALAVVPLFPAAWLAVRIVQRGVLEPVAHLRRATLRLAAGDFAHRVPVRSADELGALSAEVNHMAETIVRMHEERVERERLAAVGEMVRRIVHNLRNPLAGIRGLAEVTRHDVAHDELLRENQDRIISTVDRFERWLADLLTATKPLEVVAAAAEVGPWLRGLLDAQRPAAEARSVRLEPDLSAAPPSAVFDPRHLEQAVIALVSNAIDASPAGGVVWVRVGGAGEGQWTIRVEDQGPGVPLDLREQVFRPYFTTKRDGTGIGLALVRQIVEQHAGRAWVEDRSGGRGAAFVVRLPVDGPPGGTEKSGVGAGGGENSRHRG